MDRAIFDFLNLPASEAAPRLLGCLVEREVDGRKLVGRIVETEAYDQTDAASHSYRGRTPRTDIMFGPAGHLYVYYTYGMHYCCNIVTGNEGVGSAVLIRAIEPVEGEEYMAELRGKTGIEMTNGPAKFCQAFAIGRRLNGHDLQQPPLKLVVKSSLKDDQIGISGRIGISTAKDTPWRFFIIENPYVSHVKMAWWKKNK